MKQSRREFLRDGALAAFGVMLAPTLRGAVPVRPVRRKPNIVFILADDLGIDALGCYGGDTFKTPVLDKLAESGIRFDRAYCTPVCGPTRAQLMTGQYPFRNGAIEIDRTMSAANPDECPSLAETLNDAGYATGMAGKWKQMRLTPGDWGFKEWLMSPTAGGYYWQKSWIRTDEEITVDEEVYFPDVIDEFAREFIREHADEPFYLYYAMTNPHVPIVRTPDTKPGVTDKRQLYADNIAYVDKLVGKVVAELDELGIRDDTLLVFSGDNGSVGNMSGTVHGKKLAGGKARMSEGGAHVPLIANWPGTIKRGRICDDLVDFTDLLPTFADVAGAELSTAKGKLDGRSFLPQLKGRKGDPRGWIFVQLGHYYYVRSRDWRLDELGRLTDMRTAPYQEKLVPDDTTDPEVMAARARLEHVLDDLDPKSGKTYDEWRGFTLNGVRYRGAELQRPD
jgi:arylsulfatase A